MGMAVNRDCGHSVASCISFWSAPWSGDWSPTPTHSGVRLGERSDRFRDVRAPICIDGDHDRVALDLFERDWAVETERLGAVHECPDSVEHALTHPDDGSIGRPQVLAGPVVDWPHALRHGGVLIGVGVDARPVT